MMSSTLPERQAPFLAAGASAGAALTQLHRLMSSLNRGLDLDETLASVVECVVAGLGFGVGVISMIQDDGDLMASAIAGNADACASLEGARSTRAEWDRLLALGEPVGPSRLLRLLDHRLEDAWVEGGVPTWVPPSVVPAARLSDDRRRAWHPLDALFAPLVSPGVGLLGVLSVDLPHDGLVPGADQLGLLEMFAVQAAVAIEHARLHTEVLAAKEKARSALALRLRSVVEASPAALVEVDTAGTVREWNRAAEQLFGHGAADVLGRPLPDLFLDHSVHVPSLLEVLTPGAPIPVMHLRGRHRDGGVLDVELSSAITVDPAGEVSGVMGLMVDISERRRLQTRLEHQATHDPLTDLPNRQLLLERLAAALSDGDGATAVLVIDLDHFREVNDTLGHGRGDLLLSAVGARLAAALRPCDLTARLAGDEFAVLLPGLADQTAAAGTAQRLLEELHKPFDLDGVTVDVEASIGVSVAPRDGTDPVLLMRQADVALYQAKDLAAGVVVYSPDRAGPGPGRLALLGELRRALDAHELVVHYQPQVDLRSGELCGLEALVRWQHPDRGLLPPGAFLPVAETTGLVTPLTLRVLDLVLAQVRQWADEGQEVPVAVNLSARCLSDTDLPDVVAAALARHGVPARLLWLEVTESATMTDPERALGILRRLSADGVRLSIDDFGTGYSSMSYLRRLPVGELKVDRSFVSEMTRDDSDAVLVRSTVDLGHNLGLSVVAEGVEDEETLRALSDLGCDVAQGYLLGRPMAPEALAGWRAEYEQRRHGLHRAWQPLARADGLVATRH